MPTPSPRDPIVIASFSGYYGDRLTALDEAMAGDPCHVLIGDYLAEITLAGISARFRKDPTQGHADYFVKQIAPHLPAMAGTDAIREWATTSFNFPGFNVTWNVMSAEVAQAGDVGYTLGTFTFEMTMPDGMPLKDSGKYATVWKKQVDGSWKVAVDAFNSEIPLTPMGSGTPEDSTAVQGQ